MSAPCVDFLFVKIGDSINCCSYSASALEVISGLVFIFLRD